MNQLVDDLVAEQSHLDAAVVGLPDASWELLTPAPGWLVRDCIAHLMEFDEAAVCVVRQGNCPPQGDPQPPLSAIQLAARDLEIVELVERWRGARSELASACQQLEPGPRLPWAPGTPMSARSFVSARLMECWAHGLDVLEAAGIQAVDTDRLRHIAHLGYITRGFSYRNRDLDPNDEPLFVELIAPSRATWTWGPVAARNRIVGTAGDFCRVVNQRIHYRDTGLEWTSAAAEEFLQVALAFAGPPGEGRPQVG
ncbi:MAG TPA: TIGR03084 family metal-binding protein [Dehalococcoidia bacterium]|nr:TIGR03084 family metal-binding protein [Dehalococcoidia bacterium]